MTSDGDDVGAATVDRARWVWVRAWDAGYTVRHGKREVRTVQAEGPCCSDTQRTYSDGHRDERGQAMAGWLRDCGKTLCNVSGHVQVAPEHVLELVLKFEV